MPHKEIWRQRRASSAFDFLNDVRTRRNDRMAQIAAQEIAQQQEALSRQQVARPRQLRERAAPEASLLENLGTLGKSFVYGGVLPFDIRTPREGFQTPPIVEGVKAAGRAVKQVGQPIAGFVYPAGDNPTLKEFLGGSSGMLTKLFFQSEEAKQRSRRNEERQKQAREKAFSQLMGGDFGGAAGTLTEYQQSRSPTEQFISEAITDPTNLIPFGLFAKGGKAAVMAAAARRVRPADEALAILPLSSPQELWSQIHDPGVIANLLKATVERIPGQVGVKDAAPRKFGPWAVDKFSYTVMADETDIVRIGQAAETLHLKQAQAGVSTLMSELRVPGDYRAILNLDQFGRSRRLGASVQELMQFPDAYDLNVLERTWIDNSVATVSKMVRYLDKEGIISSDIIGKVPGNYIPNIMNEYRGTTLRVAQGGPRFGMVPFFKKDRLYIDAGKAADAGYSGDPMQAMQLFFEDAYKAVSDKQIVALIKPHGNSLIKRLGVAKPGLAEEVRLSQTKLQSTRAAANIIKQFSLHVPRERTLETGKVVRTGISKQVRARAIRSLGRTKAAGFNADLLERLDKVLRKRSPELFAKEIARIREELGKRLVIDTRQRRELVLAAQKAKQLVKVDSRFGEVSFPGTAFGDTVFTASDKIKSVFPEQEVSNLGTMPQWEIDELTKMVRGDKGGGWKAFARTTASVSTASRTLQSGFDLGYLSIHGLPIMLTNRRAWMRSTSMMMRAWRDPAVMGTYLRQNGDYVEELHALGQLSGAEAELVESLAKGGLLDRTFRGIQSAIPGIRTGPDKPTFLNKIAQSMANYLLASKIELYASLRPLALASGQPNAMRELAEHVSRMTGTMDLAHLGITPFGDDVASGFLMYARRYRLSVYGLIKEATTSTQFKGELARTAIGKMAASGLLMYTYVAHRLGQEPQLDPSKGSFLTVKVGEARIGIGSAFVSTARFVGSASKQLFTDTGQLVRVHERDSAVNRFVRGQIAPTAGTVWDLVTGKSYMGDPTNGTWTDFGKNAVADRVLPFWASGLLDTPRPGWSSSMAMVGAEMFGARSYPSSLYQKAMGQANIIAHQQGDVDFKDLTGLERDKILAAHPEIQQLLDENNALWAGRGQEVNEFKEEFRRYNDDIYQPELSRILANFERDFDGEKFRELYGKLNAARRWHSEDVRRRFASVVEMLEGREKEPAAYLEDVAYDEYISTVVTGDFDDPETGEFNFRLRQEAEQAIIKKYGEETFQTYIVLRLQADLPPLIRELQDGRRALASYWKVGESLLERIGNDSLIEPWRAYMESPFPEERKEMEIDYPGFRELKRSISKARQLRREMHAPTDAWLLRWGYPGLLRNPENQLRGPGTIRQTPTRFE